MSAADNDLEKKLVWWHLASGLSIQKLHERHDGQNIDPYLPSQPAGSEA
jgi:hypothetical protein